MELEPSPKIVRLLLDINKPLVVIYVPRGKYRLPPLESAARAATIAAVESVAPVESAPKSLTEIVSRSFAWTVLFVALVPD